MVRVELSYNPYLLKTDVSFNGNPPRINSLVEKYQKGKLQKWINLIPKIFHDEMNGYGFELIFSGTDKDFEELTKAFSHVGIGHDLVPMFHKGELKSRYEKSMAIDELLKWLKDNPNRGFDYNLFMDDNRDLFKEPFLLYVVGGQELPENLFEDIDIKEENVKSIAELRKTDLYSTPIMMYVDKDTISTLQTDICEIMNRSDVDQEQLFFVINPELRENVVRVLKDLGINNPQVVTSEKDDLVHQYFELFPVSEYISEAINVFNAQIEELERKLDDKKIKSEGINKGIHESIKDKETVIDRLKDTYDLVVNKENLEFPEELIKGKKILIDEIKEWRNKRTKITNNKEAVEAAALFDAEIGKWLKTLMSVIYKCYFERSTEISTNFEKMYKSAGYEDGFKPKGIKLADFSMRPYNPISNELLELKEERYVDQKPKEDLFAFLFKPTKDNTSEQVLETTYYYEKWREYAIQRIDPFAEALIQEVYTNLKEYYNNLAAAYSWQLEEMIRKDTAEKLSVSNQLSEDERLLQADNDWIKVFSDKLRDIERS